jgi:hypothetical protein
MTIDGVHFGKPGKCVLPIFMDTRISNDNDYYLGSHAMYEEYVVYDNTQVKDTGVSTVSAHIGLAKLADAVAVTKPLDDLYY